GQLRDGPGVAERVRRLRSTKFATASIAASTSSPVSTTASAGSAPTTSSHVPTSVRPVRSMSPSSTTSRASSGSNCLPARPRARAFAASTPPTRWATSTNSASCESGAARAPELVVVLSRLGSDVVPEPLRLLVCVGVAADVDQQGRVVDGCALVLVEPDSLREPERDQALPEHMLHRLPEPEVDAERQ